MTRFLPLALAAGLLLGTPAAAQPKLPSIQERVRLELTIAAGADEPGDTIELDADPPVKLVIPGGVSGDRATANLVVNAAPRVTAAQPGLLTVLELPSAR